GALAVDPGPHALGEHEVAVAGLDALDDALPLGIEDERARLPDRAGKELAQPVGLDRARHADARVRVAAAIEIDRDEELRFADDALRREDEARPPDHQRAR